VTHYTADQLAQFPPTEDWAEALEDHNLLTDDTVAMAQLIQTLDDYGVTAENLCDALAGIQTAWSERQAGVDFCAEFAESCGLLDSGAQWPLNHIDWDSAWEDLRLSDNYAAVQNPANRGEYLILRSV
jgi:hypothetical protein